MSEHQDINGRTSVATVARAAGWRRSRTVSTLCYDVWTNPADGAEVQVDFYDDEPSQVTAIYLGGNRDEVRKSDQTSEIVGWFA